jgi:hypothetical protein
VRRTAACLVSAPRAAAPLLLLAACAVPPEGTSAEDIEFYENAVASLDCELVTERDYRVVQFQADLTRETALALTRYALEQGRAESLEAGGIRLVAGPCAPDATGGPGVIAIEGTG